MPKSITSETSTEVQNSFSPSANGFAAMGLGEPLLRAVAALGFTTPTAVQIATIPAALKGGDWMVSSQTGSGKTAAFLLPALQQVLDAPMPKFEQHARTRKVAAAPRILVLAPTRELAAQVSVDAINLVRFCKGVRVAVITGGASFYKQVQDLRDATLVVATPGRLLDLHRNNQISLDAVQTLIVDEADRMLDLGFSEDLEAIHVATMRRTRTLMFSATFAPRIMVLAENVMRSPQKIALTSNHDTHKNIEQRLHWCDDNRHKAAILDHYLSDSAITQAIIFTPTQIETDQLSDQLREAGHLATALHGGIPQAMRTRRIKALREGQIQFLVATDVAARGIDVPAISHVINYGLPMKAEDYVHRIGRTGRAGRDGIAITLAIARDRFRIRDIERLTQNRIAETTIAGLEPTTNPQSGKGGSSRGGRNSASPREYGNARGGERHAFSAARETRAPREYQEGRPSRPAFAERTRFSESRNDTPRSENRGFQNRNDAPRDFAPAPRTEMRRDEGTRPAAPRHDASNDRWQKPNAERTASRSFQPRNDAQDARGGERFQRFERSSNNNPNDRNERYAPRRASAAPDSRRQDDWKPRAPRSEHSERSAHGNAPYGAPRTRQQAQGHEQNAHNTAPRKNREAKSAPDRSRGPAITPPAAGGNRAQRRAALQSTYAERMAQALEE